MKILITTMQHLASYHLAYLLKDEELTFGDTYPQFPKENSISYAHELLKFCLDEAIEQVFPLRKGELAPLLEATLLFEEFGIELMLGLHPVVYNEPNRVASSFAELSANLLKLGYPNTKLAIGHADGSGSLISIDDTQQNFVQIWNKVNSISFTQSGKLFNHPNFTPLAIYTLKDACMQMNVLYLNQELHFTENLSEQIQNEFLKIAAAQQAKGFYQIAFSATQILRIKNAAL